MYQPQTMKHRVLLIGISFFFGFFGLFFVSNVTTASLIDPVKTPLPFSCDAVTETPQSGCTALMELYSGTSGSTLENHDGELTTNLSRFIYLPLLTVPDSQCWEHEPNDTYQNANGPLLSGVKCHGFPNDRKDYFKVIMPTRGLLQVDLTKHTGHGVQLQLFYQSVANQVAYVPSPPYHIDYRGEAGTYFIYIYTESGYNSTMPYTLVVNYPLPPTPTPTPTPTPSPTPINRVYVPAGAFTMGSPDGEGYDDEHPQHTVYLDAFWIDRTEVTNAMYQQCVNAGACQANYNYGSDFNAPDQPVVGVNWHDAKAYCEWAGKRLPTEAEWEKAARGTDGRKYPWGNQSPNCSLLNYSAHSGACVGHTTPVGSYPAGASPYGALDMAGNVWEWVSDWYNANYYINSPLSNPTGPNSGEMRSLRGGGWRNNSDYVRVPRRGKGFQDVRRDYGGFRCAFTP